MSSPIYMLSIIFNVSLIIIQSIFSNAVSYNGVLFQNFKFFFFFLVGKIVSFTVFAQSMFQGDPVRLVRHNI